MTKPRLSLEVKVCKAAKLMDACVAIMDLYKYKLPLATPDGIHSIIKSMDDWSEYIKLIVSIPEQDDSLFSVEDICWPKKPNEGY